MYRAKLKRGGHSGGQLVQSGGTLSPEPLGGFNPGDVIESPTDLATRWPEKFDPVIVHEVVDSAVEDNLEGYTVAELREIAADEGVELDGSERKAEIISAIELARELV